MRPVRSLAPSMPPVQGLHPAAGVSSPPTCWRAGDLKRFSDVFDDEVDRPGEEFCGREVAASLVDEDHRDEEATLRGQVADLEHRPPWLSSGTRSPSRSPLSWPGRRTDSQTTPSN